MRALVKYGICDGEVEIRDVPRPNIGPLDVLLEVKSAGICGFDIEMWRHKMATEVTVPVIQGHEFAGVVREVGSGVSGFAEGDRVVSETAAVVCGECKQCRTGNYNLCPDRKGFGYGVDGAFTQFVKVPARCLHRIPEGVSFDHASLTEPACVAYNAIAVQSEVRPGEPVVIIGPGPVGLMSLQMARACGAGPVILVGASRDGVRFEVGKQLGADCVVDASVQNAADVVREMTSGEGAPLVIDAAGNEKAVALAMKCVARRGQITKIGWGPRPINLSLDPLISKSVRLQGSFSHNWPIWEAVLSMVSRGTILMEPMITHRIALEDWEETYKAVESCAAVKAVIRFGD